MSWTRSDGSPRPAAARRSDLPPGSVRRSRDGVHVPGPVARGADSAAGTSGSLRGATHGGSDPSQPSYCGAYHRQRVGRAVDAAVGAGPRRAVTGQRGVRYSVARTRRRPRWDSNTRRVRSSRRPLSSASTPFADVEVRDLAVYDTPISAATPPRLPVHPNIRGRAYYTGEEAVCSLTPPRPRYKVGLHGAVQARVKTDGRRGPREPWQECYLTLDRGGPR